MKLIAPRVIAAAQVLLSMVFLIGYFGTLAMFLLGHIRTPPEWRDVLATLLSVITAGVLQILHFWFQRTRGDDGKEEKPPD